MGKKKDKESPLNVPHRDAYLRMNFLYQAATLITAMSAPGPTPTTDTTTTEDSEKKRKDEEKKTDSLQSLGAYYAKTMKTVGKKLVIRTWVFFGAGSPRCGKSALTSFAFWKNPQRSFCQENNLQRVRFGVDTGRERQYRHQM